MLTFSDMMAVDKYLELADQTGRDPLVSKSSQFYKDCQAAGLEFAVAEGDWVLVPKWLMQAVKAFGEQGYADLTLPEYLSKLIGEEDG